MAPGAAAAASQKARKKAGEQRQQAAHPHDHHAHKSKSNLHVGDDQDDQHHVPSSSTDSSRKKPGLQRSATHSENIQNLQHIRNFSQSVDDLTGWRKYQPQAKRLYNHIIVQVGVAALIGGNFAVNIIQAQIDPTGDDDSGVFAIFEIFFNVVFLVELALNMYSSWLCDFWRSGWNVFDLIVVLIAWMFLLNVPLPGPMKLLRMLRAFRVFRLFKRVASLRKILNSLAKAMPGMRDAFLIQLIVMSIYAIIGVDRFHDYGEGGSFTNEKGMVIELYTDRDQEWGFEYFGDFGKSLYTMFQVLTGDSWSEVVCRPLFHSASATTRWGSLFFFVSFVLLNAVVLINVVVAVLLEKMVDDTPSGDDAPADPLKERVEATVDDVTELRNQMDHLVEVACSLQRQLADVSGVKEQLAILLAHKGIQVQQPPLRDGVPSGLVAAAQGDDPNGYASSPKPPAQPKKPKKQLTWGADIETTAPTPEIYRPNSPESMDAKDYSDESPTTQVAIAADTARQDHLADDDRSKWNGLGDHPLAPPADDQVFLDHC